MTPYKSAGVRLIALIAGAALLIDAGLSARQLPLQPARERGQNVTPAFEGWFENDDGSFSLLIGYFNRNTKEILDIPIGPDNRIEPDGPDYGQPTHFLLRRQWGVFVIRAPKEFGKKLLTWTVVANGMPASIPVGLIKDYQIEPYKDVAMGNTPPVLRFAPGGPAHQGPPRDVALSLTTRVNELLTLNVWATDDNHSDPGLSGATAARLAKLPPVSVTWTKFRGPGEVMFSEAKPKVDESDGRTTTTATFSAPGEYMLRAQGNDKSGDGGGGFQCCWTNTFVKVTVTGSRSTSAQEQPVTALR